MRVFQQAVRSGDYTTAARKLGMDRTTVGRRFARLERDAGRSLWEQTEAGYRPTQAGRAVLRAAGVMERAMVRLEQMLAMPGSAGPAPVRIAGTAGIAALLLPELAAMLERHGALGLEVVGARDAIAAINQRHADIGLAIARTKPQDLAGRRIGPFEQALYERSDGAVDRRIAWGHAMLLANPQPWARLNAIPPVGAAVEVDSLAALHAAVRGGLGRAWLWRVLGDGDASLRRLPDPPPAAASAELWILHRGDLAVEPAVTALRDDAAEVLERFTAGQAR